MAEPNADGAVVLDKETGGGVEVRRLAVPGHDETVVLRCIGYVDSYNAVKFAAAVSGVIAHGARNVIFDLAQTTYMSSTAIGAFPTFLRDVKQKGGDIVLAAMTKKVHDLFQLLGLATFFNTVETVEDALSWIPKPGDISEIPYDTMLAITSSFERLERLVDRGHQQQFYREIASILQHIQTLRKPKNPG